MDQSVDLTNFESLGCHLCNSVGTEACDETYGACLCKPWYEGEYCQNCRFSRDFVLAPNGSCIPCNCGLRSIYECFQSNLCMKYAGDSVREAVAVSALFLSAIATITCLSVCIVWRIIVRSKRLSPMMTDDDETDPETGSKVDSISVLSRGDGDFDDVESTSDRRFLLTPIISGDFDFANVSISSGGASFDLNRTESVVKSNEAEFKNNDRYYGKNETPRRMNGKNDFGYNEDRDCTKYYFLNVRCENAADENGGGENV